MSNVLSVLSFESQEIRLRGSAENPEWVAADVAMSRFQLIREALRYADMLIEQGRLPENKN